jgi:hypothetical protein
MNKSGVVQPFTIYHGDILPFLLVIETFTMTFFLPVDSSLTLRYSHLCTLLYLFYYYFLLFIKMCQLFKMNKSGVFQTFTIYHADILPFLLVIETFTMTFFLPVDSSLTLRYGHLRVHYNTCFYFVIFLVLYNYSGLHLKN